MRAMKLVVLALAVAGCAVEENAFGPADDRFVQTMVDLRRAAIEAGRDTARFEELRADVLEKHSLSAEDLRAYVAAHSTDLEHMAAVWDSVSARLADPAPQ